MSESYQTRPPFLHRGAWTHPWILDPTTHFIPWLMPDCTLTVMRLGNTRNGNLRRVPQRVLGGIRDQSRLAIVTIAYDRAFKACNSLCKHGHTRSSQWLGAIDPGFRPIQIGRAHA